MDEPPALPVGPIVAWLAIVADVAGVAWLVGSSAPVLSKATVVGLQVLGAWTIFIYYLGQRRQWGAKSTVARREHRGRGLPRGRP